MGIEGTRETTVLTSDVLGGMPAAAHCIYVYTVMQMHSSAQHSAISRGNQPSSEIGKRSVSLL